MRWEKVAQIEGQRQYLCYPTLYQSQLIPDHVFEKLHSRWASNYIDLPEVTFHIARDVFVLAEGLVFFADGTLIEQTRTTHTDTDIERARIMLAGALQKASHISSHRRAILCKKRGVGNYGHWLVEMLPKAFWAVRRAQAADWPVVVNRGSPVMRSVMIQSLAAIEIGPERIIEADDKPMHFEELLIVSGLTIHTTFLSPLVMQCMDFISAKAQNIDRPNLYPVRYPAKTRDFEDTVTAAKILEEAGYAPVECANMPFLDQVSAFKSAKRIAGPMGAALTNIVFCQPGTEILVFMPATAMELFFWLIAQARKLDYYEIRCEETGPQLGALPWDRSLRISPTAMKGLIWLVGTTKDIAGPPLSSMDTKNIDRDRVITSKWRLTFNKQPNITHTIKFNADGTIDGYKHQNETFWKLSNGNIEMYTSKGHHSWSFTVTKVIDGKFKLRSRCLLPGLASNFSHLYETIS